MRERVDEYKKSGEFRPVTPSELVRLVKALNVVEGDLIEARAALVKRENYAQMVSGPAPKATPAYDPVYDVEFD